MQKALFKENVAHPSLGLRRWIGGLYGSRTGRTHHTHFALTFTTGMSFTVGTGVLVAMNSVSSAGDAYYFDSDTALTRTCDPSDSQNPRNDLVVAKITDNFIAGTTNIDDVIVVKGSPSSTPQDPALPTDGTYVALWRIRVNAQAVALSSLNATDIRPPVIGLAGTPQPAASAADQNLLSNLRAGSSVWREDLKHPVWMDALGAWYDPIQDLLTHLTNSDSNFSSSLANITSKLGLGGLQMGNDYKVDPFLFNGIGVANAALFSSYGSILTFGGTSSGGALQMWVNQSSTVGAGQVAAAMRTYDSATSKWGPWQKLTFQAQRAEWHGRLHVPGATGVSGTVSWYTNRVYWPSGRFSVPPVVTCMFETTPLFDGTARASRLYMYGITTASVGIRYDFEDTYTGPLELHVHAFEEG